jgi:DNA-directed RNA polymerase specialized sigma24 family protein
LESKYTRVRVVNFGEERKMKTELAQFGRRWSDRPLTEAKLIRGAQKGNEEAFSALFDAYKSQVYSLCLRAANNKLEAEGLTQDAFLHAFRRLAISRGEVEFSTCLFQTVATSIRMLGRDAAAATSSPAFADRRTAPAFSEAAVPAVSPSLNSFA